LLNSPRRTRSTKTELNASSNCLRIIPKDSHFLAKEIEANRAKIRDLQERWLRQKEEYEAKNVEVIGLKLRSQRA